MDGDTTIGFIGLGRLGLPVAELLLETDHAVYCCARGRSDELVAKGARVAGDGSPRAVAESAAVVFTCLPGSAVESVIGGAHGVLAAAGRSPTVVELSTAPIPVKQRLREKLVARGGELLDCPVSGTPAMAAARIAIIYASGDRQTYDEVAELLAAISPGVEYVGELGTGTKMKYVANLLALVHVTAAAEGMALATALGLDLDQVVQLISRSPAASSGQFNVRAPMIAAGQFEGKLVEIRDVRENLAQITAAAREVGAAVPLASTARSLFDEIGERGEEDRDPAKLAVYLARGGTASGWMGCSAPDPNAPEQDERRQEVADHASRTRGERLYVALSRVNADSPPPPPDVIFEHQSWAQGLERTGVVFAAGPFVDDDGAILGDGMYVVRAATAAEAAERVATDPFHLGGFRRCTVHAWALHQGTINLSINLSDGTYSFG